MVLSKASKSVHHRLGPHPHLWDLLFVLGSHTPTSLLPISLRSRMLLPDVFPTFPLPLK